MASSAERGAFDEQAIRTIIRQVILEIAPNESFTELKSEYRLVDELGFHSLALLEMAFTLEDEFGLDPITEEDAQKILTAGDVEEYVVNELRRKRNPVSAMPQES